MPNVQVAIRCRPKLDHESGIPSTKLEINEHANSIAVLSQNNAKTFKFDKVFSESASQQDVFDYVAPMIDNVLNGLHSTVFAYGQTGSGKTFTMDGFNYAPATTNSRGEPSAPKPRADTPAYQHGVVPRVIQLLFDRARERMGGETADEADAANATTNADNDDGMGSTMRYKLKCSFMQLYNEKISDLLNPSSTKNSKEGLKIRWTRNDQFAVENLYVFECDSPEQMRDMFMMGIKEKVMGSHHMNLQSSRSHSLFTIHVHSWDANAPDLVRKSELTLVDLAGSEKLHLLSQNPTQQLLKESIEINTSLLALGKVITALATNSKQHIPYRDSKLTKLLKHALGGNSVTTMIACCNPLDPYVEETVSTLLYASRARNITNDPRVNENPQSALIRSLREEIQSLKMELEYYRQLVATGVVDDGLAKRLANRLDKDSAGSNALAIKDGSSPEPRRAGENVNKNPRAHSSSVAGGDNNSANDDGTVDPNGGVVVRRSEVEIELAEKLTESCNILKSLMGVNAQLRTAFDRLKTAKEAVDKRELAVNAENTALRERIEMLESIAMNEGDGGEGSSTNGPSSRRKSSTVNSDDHDDDDEEGNGYDDGNGGGDFNDSSSHGNFSSSMGRRGISGSNFGASQGGQQRTAATQQRSSSSTIIKPKPKPKGKSSSAKKGTTNPPMGTYQQKLQDYANKYRNPQRSVAYEDYYGRSTAPPRNPAPANAFQHSQRFDTTTTISTDVEERKSRDLQALLDQLNSKMPKSTLDMVPKSLQDNSQFGALSFGGGASDVQQMEERRRARHERLRALQSQNMSLMGAAPPPLVLNMDNIPNGHLMVMGGPQPQQQQQQNQPIGVVKNNTVSVAGLSGGGLFASQQQQSQQQHQQPQFNQLLGSGARPNNAFEDGSGGGTLNFGHSASAGAGTDRLLRPSSGRGAANGGSSGGNGSGQSNAEKLFAYLSTEEMSGAFTAEQLAKLRNRGGGGAAAGAGGGAPPTLSSDPRIMPNGNGPQPSSSRRGQTNSAPSTPISGRIGGGGGGQRTTNGGGVPEPIPMASTRGGGGMQYGGSGGTPTGKSSTSSLVSRLSGLDNGVLSGRHNGIGGSSSGGSMMNSSALYASVGGGGGVSTPRSKSSYDMGYGGGGSSGDRGRATISNASRPMVGSLGALGTAGGMGMGMGMGGGTNTYAGYGGGAGSSHTMPSTVHQPQPRAPHAHEAMHRREQQQNEQQRYQQQIYEAQQALIAQQQKLAQQRR